MVWGQEVKRLGTARDRMSDFIHGMSDLDIWRGIWTHLLKLNNKFLISVLQILHENILYNSQELTSVGKLTLELITTESIPRATREHGSPKSTFYIFCQPMGCPAPDIP